MFDAIHMSAGSSAPHREGDSACRECVDRFDGTYPKRCAEKGCIGLVHSEYTFWDDEAGNPATASKCDVCGMVEPETIEEVDE